MAKLDDGKLRRSDEALKEFERYVPYVKRNSITSRTNGMALATILGMLKSFTASYLSDF